MVDIRVLSVGFWSYGGKGEKPTVFGGVGDSTPTQCRQNVDNVEIFKKCQIGPKLTG